MLLFFVCDLISFDLLCVHVPYLRHVVSFSVVVMSFKCPTFTPLSYVGGHSHAYRRNRRFGYVILRLESHSSNFLGSSF